MKKLSGIVMVSVPFVGIFIYQAYQGGLSSAIGIFASVGTLAIWLAIGSRLIFHKDFEDED